ncbi:MAG: SBBP repeat-containing protein [Acidobacteriia bacterium]|nr:SBBP repeat-containing protein [Terriglobia bacterium]
MICILCGTLYWLPASAQVSRPILNYSTLLGGDGEDRAVDVVVDSTGSAYVTGTTTPARSTFPDIFVAKVNPAGTALVYYRTIGGSSDDAAVGIALGSAGQVYVTGTTVSKDFPTTPGAFRRAAGASGRDVFVLKLSADGNSVLYSTYLGPAIAGGIAVDSAGSAYVSGWTYDPAFPLTPGAAQTAIKGGQDAFVTKLSPDGGALVYSTLLGSSGNDEASRIAVDSFGNAFVTGGTRAADFPTTPGTFQRAKAGSGEDAFVSKLNPSGSALVYSTYLGGTSPDGGFGIAVDASGAAYVTGITMSGDFPVTPAAFRTALQGSSDAFVTKIAPDGSRLAYSTLLGGDQATAIAVDALGLAYVVGPASSGGFPITGGSLCDRADVFLARLDAAGSGLRFATYLSTAWGAGAEGVAVDSQGGVYVVGHALSPFPVTPGAAQTVPNAGDPNAINVPDAFVMKISEGVLPSDAVVSVPGASFLRYAPVSPASMVSAFGTNLAPRLELASTIPLPTVLAGTEVRVRDGAGVERLAPLIAVSSGQVNYLLPEGTGAGPATVTVTNAGRVAGSGTVQVDSVAPGIFTANANGSGAPAAVVVRVAPDGSQTQQFAFDCSAGAGKCLPAAIDLGSPGDQVFLLLFGTGIRGRSGLGGVKTVPFFEQLFDVLYAGPQSEYPGLDQVNLRIKAKPGMPGDLPLQLFIDGRTTNEVTLRFK